MRAGISRSKPLKAFQLEITFQTSQIVVQKDAIYEWREPREQEILFILLNFVEYGKCSVVPRSSRKQ